MSWVALWEIFQGIGSAIGILLTIGTFITLITKKPKEFLKKALREECTAATRDMDNRLSNGQSEIIRRLNESDKTDIVSLRYDITWIYYQYKDTKVLPAYIKQSLLDMYERYQTLGGNSYVHTIVEEMKMWDVD